MSITILTVKPLTQTDPAFYTDSRKPQIVAMAYGKFSIMRCGQMLIHYRDEELRLTQDLLNAGLLTDADLQEAEDSGELTWDNNSWFEIWSDSDAGYEQTDEVFFSIRDAYRFIQDNLIEKEDWMEDEITTTKDTLELMQKEWYEEGKRVMAYAIIEYLIEKNVLRESFLGNGYVAVDIEGTEGVDLTLPPKGAKDE